MHPRVEETRTHSSKMNNVTPFDLFNRKIFPQQVLCCKDTRNNGWRCVIELKVVRDQCAKNKRRATTQRERVEERSRVDSIVSKNS